LGPGYFFLEIAMSFVDRIEFALAFAEDHPWSVVLPAGVLLGLMLSALV
jgi:hypothetical protein